MRKPLNKNFFAGIAYMLFLSFGLNAQNCIMNCKDTAIIVLDNNCQAIVNSDQIYINPQDCPGPGTVHIYNYLGIDLGNIVDGTYMDSILHIIITGYAGTQYSCTSKLIIKDITGPMIECKDTLISCMENNKPDPKLPSFLLIHDNCSIIDTAYYADQVYNFSCKNNGVNTYFADNWIIDTSCAGIGKVLFNINQFVLIGAGDTINPPKGNCSTTMTIKIPVDGKISFDWLVKGHADKDMEALYCKINNVLWKLSSKDTLMGTFNSPDLFIGDELSIELFSDGDSVFNTAYISGFEFTTKITELIIRTWTAIDKKGNSSSKIQKISIESIDLNLVSFPTDYDGVANNKISCSGDYSISATGQPKYAYPLNVNSGKLSILKSNNCVNVEYVDKKDSICGGSFKLTRSWRITDKCKSTLLTHDQIIIVEDLQAPVISAPYELIYSTDADKCSGKVIIPPVTATDQCSPKNINVSINTSFGTNGYGPFPNVPIGDHLVFYTATDECGNSAQASSKITVKDKTTPIAIVKSNLIYYLPLSGQLKIYAKDIDMGSTDNCCIQGFKIKRVNEPVSLFKDELILN
ncbi:MAG TPA: HYR domain-containing protein, partial [Saprospiraceae bacterium]|nr:HYR domain-containing protein [Saprospiraceae bacterium]